MACEHVQAAYIDFARVTKQVDHADLSGGKSFGDDGEFLPGFTKHSADLRRHFAKRAIVPDRGRLASACSKASRRDLFIAYGNFRGKRSFVVFDSGFQSNQPASLPDPITRAHTAPYLVYVLGLLNSSLRKRGGGPNEGKIDTVWFLRCLVLHRR